MTCSHIGSGVIVCGPPQGVYRRLMAVVDDEQWEAAASEREAAHDAILARREDGAR